MTFSIQAWKDWFDEDAPEEALLPDSYGNSLDTFRKLLLVRSWCPDRMIPMAKMYVAEALGKEVSRVWQEFGRCERTVHCLFWGRG